MRVVGVDGCAGGWIAVIWNTDDGAWEPAFHATIELIFDSYPDADCIGIDMPIGLRDDGRSRGCDVAARALLGWPRGASVFSAPQRRLLEDGSYPEVNARSREHFGKGISRQAYGIFGKVREVDAAMTPERQRRVIEVHPEVSFWAMNGARPLERSKKTDEGFHIRSTLLTTAMRLNLPDTRRAARRQAPFAGVDDLLDALAVAWTARRHAAGEARRLVAGPAVDARELRMEISV